MKTENLDKLASLSRPEAEVTAVSVVGRLGNGRFDAEFDYLASMANGLFAFESALHVYPANGDALFDVFAWNSPDLWSGRYGDMSAGLVFFAEDVLGGQFAFRADEIVSFDPETGQCEAIATTLNEWAGVVLADFEYLTGYPLAHVWQLENGALAAGRRLVPKVPFVLGGQFDIGNLYDSELVAAMRFRADLARQIRDLPDGASVRLAVE